MPALASTHTMAPLMAPVSSSSSSSASFSSSSSAASAIPSASSPPSTLAASDLVFALHDFVASAPAGNTCLSFKSGQVIRVLNRDKSGWWDGEIVSGPPARLVDSVVVSPPRGWFPSNYVAPILSSGSGSGSSSGPSSGPRHSNHLLSTRRPSLASTSSARSSSEETRSSIVPDEPMSSSSPDPDKFSFDPDPHLRGHPNHLLPEVVGFSCLLKPIMEAIHVLQAEVQRERVCKVQPATAYIISAVRSVLHLTNCLNRDSPLLQLHPTLLRERKHILSVLACLVDSARNISTAASSQAPTTKSSVDHGNIAATDSSPRKQMEHILVLADRVLAHVRRFLFLAQRCGVHLPTGASIQFDLDQSHLNPHSQPHLSRETNSLALVEETSRLPSAGESHRPIPHPSNSPRLTHVSSHPVPRHSRSSSLKSLASSSVPSCLTTPTNSLPPTIYNAGQIARLADRSHDQVLSTVAVFIGHAHLHSRTAHPSSHAHLIDMTRDVIDNVREMLVLVESIFKKGDEQNQSSEDFALLTDAREALYLATTSLVTATRVATSGPTEDAPLAGEDELDALLVSATSVLRAANDSMGAVSKCLSVLDPDSGQYEVATTITTPSTTAAATTTTTTSSSSSSSTPTETATTASIHTVANSCSDHELSHSVRSANRTQYTGIAPQQCRASQRPRHTLSMLGRKASALAFARSQIGTDEMPPSEWGSPLLSSDTPGSPTRLSDATSSSFTQQDPASETLCSTDASSPLLSGGGSLATPPAHGTHRQAHARPRRRSDSLSGSSDSHHSLDSSPPTSAVASQAEDEATRQLDCFHPGSDILGRCADPPGSFSAIGSGSGSLEEINLDSRYSADYSPGEVSFNASGHVVGGTLRGLVARMTLHDTPVEVSFSQAFFMTFRMFATPSEVAHALIVRFALTFPSGEAESATPEALGPTHPQQKATPIRLRVYNVFKSWLELHWRIEDTVVLPVILHWAETQLHAVLPAPAERLCDLVRKRTEQHQKGNQFFRVESRSRAKKGHIGSDAFISPPAPIASKHLMNLLRQGSSAQSALQLLDFDPAELARQITLIESKMYCAITPEEIIGQQFSKKPGAAVNVRAMSGMSTKMTGWIIESVLNESDARKRAQILKFWIKLGNRLLEMRNYNALMALMSALNSSTITRLKKTWDGTGAKSKSIYEGLNKAVSHHRNYAEYRATLRKAPTPCIPFLGVYLTDMTFCHEGNPTHRASPTDPNLQLINFDRYQKMAKIIIDLERFQVPFNLVEVPEIISFIERSVDSLVHKGSADSLYHRSLVLEPREASNHSAHHSLAQRRTSVQQQITFSPTLGQEGDGKPTVFLRRPS